LSWDAEVAGFEPCHGMPAQATKQSASAVQAPATHSEPPGKEPSRTGGPHRGPPEEDPGEWHAAVVSPWYEPVIRDQLLRVQELRGQGREGEGKPLGLTGVKRDPGSAAEALQQRQRHVVIPQASGLSPPWTVVSVRHCYAAQAERVD
jgi:hypothetical protein